MKRKRSFAVVSVLMLGSILLAACGAAPAGEEAAGDCQLEDEDGVVTFGAAVHLTGWMAAYDGPPRNGAVAAVDVLNAQGGIAGCPVEWKELDGQTDVATLGNIALQLIDDGADAIVAPCDFDMGAAAGQAAQESGIAVMSFCASSPLFGSEGVGDLAFTMSMWSNTMGAAAAEYALDQGWETAYVMTDTSIEYDTSLSKGFIDTMEELGGTVLAEDEFLQDDPDVAPLVQRFQEVEDEADVLFVSSYMPALAAVIRQIRGAGIDTPLIGGDSWDATEFYEAVGPDLANDMWLSTHSWVLTDEADSRINEFQEAFEATNGEPATLSFDVMGWDVVMAFALAMEAAGTTEGAAVAAELENLEFNGLSGLTDWTSAAEGHFPDKEAFIIEVQGAEPSFVEVIKPSFVPPP